MVAGLVFKKIKGKGWIFILVAKKKRKKTEMLDELGRTLVPGALNDTKQIRKAGADIFQVPLRSARAELPHRDLNQSRAATPRANLVFIVGF